jgi:HSP20 family protein
MNRLTRNSFVDIDRLFNAAITAPLATPNARTTNAIKPSKHLRPPNVDIIAATDSYQLIAELPGIEKDNIAITIDKNVLTIETKSAEKNTEESENRIIRSERFAGNYARSFNLDDNIDQSAINAEFSNGLLILTLPKQQKVEPEPKQIKIH